MEHHPGTTHTGAHMGAHTRAHTGTMEVQQNVAQWVQLQSAGSAIAGARIRGAGHWKKQGTVDKVSGQICRCRYWGRAMQGLQ